MKTTIALFINIFIVSFLNAQIKDSTKVVSALDSTKIIKVIDTVTTPLDSVKLKLRIIALRKLDSIENSRMVYINKKLLDSLLTPYYKITIDTIANDTISKKSFFSPRYRVLVNENTLDTTYVSLPKTKDFLNVRNSNGLDTLVILNPIKPISINRTQKAKDPVWWKNKNSIGLDLNEVAFLNWNAGGSNSISGLVKINFSRTYERLYTLWNTEISTRYGLNQQEDKGLLKTDDEIKINSTFGYRKDTISKWYYSIKFSLRTQFTDGFKYPNRENPISKFFAPAYLHLGAGTQFNLKPKIFSAYLSPFTLKSTFVFDAILSNEGAFGVTSGKKYRHEFGALAQGNWETEIFKNVAMSNTLGLYTDYLNKFGNIDVDWALTFKFRINNFLEADFRTHLIYDDDIKHKEDTNNDGELETLGARVQIKQQIGIGILYKF